VLSAVVLKYDERIEAELSRTVVQFRELGEDEIRQYVATGEADDKAGAYAIQGRAAQFVAAIRGSYSGVVGLPLYETAQVIERMGATRERRSPY
jgi:septum formation protein